MARRLPWSEGKSIVQRVEGSRAPTSSDADYLTGTIWVFGGVIYQLQSIIGGNATWLSGGGGSNNATEYTEYWEAITAGLSGQITIPAGSEIVLDQWAGGVDALVATIVDGVPSGSIAVDADGNPVTATLDAGGNWTISATPSSYPIALVFAERITAGGGTTPHPLTTYAELFDPATGLPLSPLTPGDKYLVSYRMRKLLVDGGWEPILDGNSAPIYHTGPVRTLLFTALSDSAIDECNVRDIDHPELVIHYTPFNNRWGNQTSPGYYGTTHSGPDQGIIYYMEDTARCITFRFDWAAYGEGYITNRIWEKSAGSGETVEEGGTMYPGIIYVIGTAGATDFTGYGSTSNVSGTIFTANTEVQLLAGDSIRAPYWVLAQDPGGGALYIDAPMFMSGAMVSEVDVVSHFNNPVLGASKETASSGDIPIIFLYAPSVYKYRQQWGTEVVSYYYPRGNVSNSEVGCCSRIWMYSLDGAVEKLVSGPNVNLEATGTGASIGDLYCAVSQRFNSAIILNCEITPAWPYPAIEGSHEGIIFGRTPTPLLDQTIQLIADPYCKNPARWVGGFGGVNGIELADAAEVITEVSPKPAIVGSDTLVDLTLYYRSGGSCSATYGGMALGTLDHVGFYRFPVVPINTDGLVITNDNHLTGGFSLLSVKVNSGLLGTAAFVNVDASSTNRYEFAGGYHYCGTAPAGSLTSATVWTIHRLTITGAVLDEVAVNVAWDDRATAIYA